MQRRSRPKADSELGGVDGKLSTIRQRPVKFALKLIGGTLCRDQSGCGVDVWKTNMVELCWCKL